MTLYATRINLSLSVTNSSASAYCRFVYSRQFFSRFNVPDDPMLDQKDDTIRVSGQLPIKVQPDGYTSVELPLTNSAYSHFSPSLDTGRSRRQLNGVN